MNNRELRNAFGIGADAVRVVFGRALGLWVLMAALLGGVGAVAGERVDGKPELVWIWARAGVHFSSAEEACGDIWAQNLPVVNRELDSDEHCGKVAIWTPGGIISRSENSAQCGVRITQVFYRHTAERGFFCDSSFSYVGGMGVVSRVPQLVCPGHSTLDKPYAPTEQCLCDSGYVAQGDQCVPAPLDNPEPETCPVHDGAQTGKPILPATGEKLYTEPDYTGTGPHPLSLVRSFRSRWSTGGAPAFASTTGLGQAWSHNYAARLSFSSTTSAHIAYGNGSTHSFAWDAASQTWRSSAGSSTLVPTTTPVSGYLLTRSEDDSRWQLDSSGNVLSVTQRNGWVTRYSYTSAGQLSTVTNHFGRSLNFTYNPAGQLSTVTTPDGQTISYTFDSAARLSSVAYPGNVSKTYLYEDSRWPQSVTGIIDERGIRLATVVYDAQGRAVESGYAGGADNYKVSYPASTGAPTTVTDPLGTQRNYSYGTTQGKLAVTSATLPSGVGQADAASRVQNANGLIDVETDFLGVQTLYSWDQQRRLRLSTTQAAGRPEAQTTSTQWHPTWRLPTLITEPGKTTAYTYDTLGNPLTQTLTDTVTGQTRSWAWSYNAQGLVDSSTDPLGRVSTYAYDTAGNLSSLKNPLGQESTFSFDTAGRVLSQTEPGGLLTRYGYDSRGRVVQITQGNETSDYSYTPSGQLASATLPSGYTVTYRYDAAQRLIAASDNRGNSIQYTLDAMGNRLREEVKDMNGNLAQVTQRSINALNRVAAISGAAGNATRFGFDANGQPTSQTDPLGHSTTQSLDALRRPTATTLADNSTATLAWNALNQLSSATDPKGVATRYQTNAFGEITSETSPDIGQLSYQRDGAGNLSASTDAKGQTTQIERDALERPTHITLNDGTQQHLSYDAAGHLAKTEDASGTSVYTRDPLGRILQKTQSVADNPANPSRYSTAYQYHRGGLPAQVSYPSGLNVFYRKSAAGQITQIDVQEPGKNQPVQPWLSNLTYTALNQPKGWYWACASGTAACDKANRSFDADGRMASNEFASYQFDAAGRITGLTQNLWALQEATPTSAATLVATPISWTAGYDARDRLTSFARPAAATRYSYDANSNRLSAIDTTTSDTDLDGDFDQSDYQKTSTQALTVAQDSNRLLGFTQTQTTSRTGAKGQPITATSSTQVNYTLDANGNLTGDGLRSFEYDAANRLSQVRIGQNLEASRITYLHNAQGLRVFKSEPQVAQTAPDEEELGASFTHWLKKNFGWLFARAQQNATLGQSYVYDDAVLGDTPSLLGEYGNGGAKSAGRMEYLWLPTESGQAIPVGLYRNNRFYAIHSDHLGTPRLITDDAGKPVWQWAYSAFGDNKPTGILKATTNPRAAMTNVPTLLKATKPNITVNLRFPGQYADEESNLFENGFRSYRPGMGAYDQFDPLGLAAGWNRRGYVGGNALSNIDPLGLATYMCTQPLHALGDKWGPRLFPESRLNPSPLYHQYACVPDGKGGMACGGQDRADGAWGPGKPSKDSFKPESCKPVDEKQCVEQCLLPKLTDPKRPDYSLFGNGGRNAGAYNCQQWADRQVQDCQQQCKAK